MFIAPSDKTVPTIESFVFEETFSYFILNFTGSQYKEANKGETWSVLLVLINIQAAAFWTNWRALIDLLRQ